VLNLQQRDCPLAVDVSCTLYTCRQPHQRRYHHIGLISHSVSLGL